MCNSARTHTHTHNFNDRALVWSAAWTCIQLIIIIKYKTETSGVIAKGRPSAVYRDLQRDNGRVCAINNSAYITKVRTVIM